MAKGFLLDHQKKSHHCIYGLKDQDLWSPLNIGHRPVEPNKGRNNIDCLSLIKANS